ncbi:junction-mediating and -regulatory protein-like [Grus japonensis]|uniref:Junction-mediating and -regulatory protein-like n=1 Tax=Grus japonensis TaxID=30415 RepID=A0ABC9Y7U7_GRUJA
MPAGFKMDPLLAKAKPISDGGSTSGARVKKEKTQPSGSFCSQREEWEDVRGTTLQTPRSDGKHMGNKKVKSQFV